MSLVAWHKKGWLRPHKTSHQEIKNLIEIVERDTLDCSTSGLSNDWCFGIAYNAGLKLCTILLYVSGYRAEKMQAHYRTIQTLPVILGQEHADKADYLDTCRMKRNETEYDFVGGISPEEARELLEFVKEFKEITIHWLKTKHSELIE